jgi:hypothetical protein
MISIFSVVNILFIIKAVLIILNSNINPTPFIMCFSVGGRFFAIALLIVLRPFRYYDFPKCFPLPIRIGSGTALSIVLKPI